MCLLKEGKKVDWTEVKPKGKRGASYDIKEVQEEEMVFKFL